MTTKIADLKKQADELSAMQILVETNEGTYGAEEARRKCGSGDPQFADYRIYECVGTGERRREGCDSERAPGNARFLNRQQLADAQSRLAKLRDEIKSLEG